MEWAVVLVAERFGLAPWEVEQAPTDRVLYYLNLLSIEGEYQQATAGMSPDDKLIPYRE